jgi:hypothetical protein
MTRAPRTESGFTITEAIITVLIFSFFMGVLFMTISYGFRTYSVAVARSDVTTEARRLVLFLENELRSSAYFSVAVESRLVKNLHRDGLSFVSMLDWSRPDSYDSIESRPNWDRYLVYYATDELPSGRLVRMAVNPPAEMVGSFPYPPFSTNPFAYMENNPLDYKGSDLVNTRVLASKIKSFEVTLVPVTQELEIKTLLRQNGIMSRRGDGTREGGTFELHYRVKPQNTK